MLMGARAASNAVASLKGSHEQAFDCQDYHLAVSIGRRRALVQPRGSEFVLTGPLACAATALIKRSPLWSIRLERFGWYDHPRLHRNGRRLGTQGDGRRTDLSDINDHVGSLHRRH
jgi:hypothetical protein